MNEEIQILRQLGFSNREIMMIKTLANERGLSIKGMLRSAMRIYYDTFQPKPPCAKPFGCMGDDDMVPPEARP